MGFLFPLSGKKKLVSSIPMHAYKQQFNRHRPEIYVLGANFLSVYSSFSMYSKNYNFRTNDRMELILVPNDGELNNDRMELILVPNDGGVNNDRVELILVPNDI